jgi:hypothetical protein
MHPLDHSFQPFTAALTISAIEKLSNSTAKGPDGLNLLHLKFLGPLGIKYLTKIYNLSIAHAKIPVVWKHANIVPIPKPGKPTDTSTSYCPISLLSPAVKVLERLQETLPTTSTQHGYKPLHSTNTALLALATQIAVGFNEPKPASRTAMVALDILKAFDAVDHVLLLKQISETTLHLNIVRWLLTYLRGRTAV